MISAHSPIAISLLQIRTSSRLPRTTSLMLLPHRLPTEIVHRSKIHTATMLRLLSTSHPYADRRRRCRSQNQTHTRTRSNTAHPITRGGTLCQSTARLTINTRIGLVRDPAMPCAHLLATREKIRTPSRQVIQIIRAQSLDLHQTFQRLDTHQLIEGTRISRHTSQQPGAHLQWNRHIPSVMIGRACPPSQEMPLLLELVIHTRKHLPQDPLQAQDRTRHTTTPQVSLLSHSNHRLATRHLPDILLRNRSRQAVRQARTSNPPLHKMVACPW